MKILIAGAGYVGAEAGNRLKAAGHRVTGWVSSETSAAPLRAAGWEVIVGDLTDPEVWARQTRLSIDALIFSASTRGGDETAYRTLHRSALARAREFAAPMGAPLIYVSSTSVYGQNDGGIVTERSMTAPPTATSRILCEAEEEVLETSGVVLRVAGIYGPGRAVLLKKFMAGEAVLEGDPARWVNQVHRDDVASVLIHVVTENVQNTILNVADDAPSTYETIYKWLAEKTGKPFPPSGPARADRKRGLTNKRVSNAALKELGWKLAYPDFRAGYARLLADEYGA